jgi:hypothetical protein
MPRINVLLVSVLSCFVGWLYTSFRRRVVEVTKYGVLNEVSTIKYGQLLKIGFIGMK